MEFETVLLDVSEGIATLTLDRSEALNAIDMDLIRDVCAAVKSLNEDPAAQALLITSAYASTFTGGRLFAQGRAASSCPAKRNNVASSPNRPTK